MALGLLALLAISATAGCAHFRDAEERATLARSGADQTMPALAQAQPVPAAPSLAPAPERAPISAHTAPPALTREVQAKPVPVRAEPSRGMTNAPLPAEVPLAALPAANRYRPTAPETAATIASTPRPVVVAGDADTAAAVAAPASAAAIITVINSPGTRCGTCDTQKISVAPSGQVLIEHGRWAAGGNWRYKRSVAHVGPVRAAAFAAGLNGDRPSGSRLMTDGDTCPGVATANDGMVVEWIEAERHDRLTLRFNCPVARHGEVAERLRHAADALGLREVVWPGAGAQ